MPLIRNNYSLTVSITWVLWLFMTTLNFLRNCAQDPSGWISYVATPRSANPSALTAILRTGFGRYHQGVAKRGTPISKIWYPSWAESQLALNRAEVLIPNYSCLPDRGKSRLRSGYQRLNIKLPLVIWSGLCHRQASPARASLIYRLLPYCRLSKPLNNGFCGYYRCCLLVATSTTTSRLELE